MPDRQMVNVYTAYGYGQVSKLDFERACMTETKTSFSDVRKILKVSLDWGGSCFAEV